MGLQAQWAEALGIESDLLHKQLSDLEQELARARQPAKADEQQGETAAPRPDVESSDLNAEQQLRILMTCTTTAERRAKQLEAELMRVSALARLLLLDTCQQRS